MAGQISVEAALPVFRQRCSELQDANLLLQARVNELEAELEQARAAAPPPSTPAMQLGAPPAEQTPYGDHANLDQQDDLERVHS